MSETYPVSETHLVSETYLVTATDFVSETCIGCCVLGLDTDTRSQWGVQRG